MYIEIKINHFHLVIIMFVFPCFGLNERGCIWIFTLVVRMCALFLCWGCAVSFCTQSTSILFCKKVLLLTYIICTHQVLSHKCLNWWVYATWKHIDELIGPFWHSEAFLMPLLITISPQCNYYFDFYLYTWGVFFGSKF